MPAPTDLTQRFLLENLDIRGQVVRLGPLWKSILARSGYPEAARQLLGEFAAIAVLVGAGLKHPGRAVLQVMGHGPVSLAVADCTRELALRAMLRVDAATFPPGEIPLQALFADGRLALTIENASTGRQFQSIVPLEGVTLAECFERYFDRSEQVPTHLWVHATGEGVGALILQKLPKADERDAHGWARIHRRAASANPATYLDRDARGIAAELFPEEDLRLFDAAPVADGCGRSEEKVVAMLRGLGRTEVEAALAEQGFVTVRDEICNQEYRFGSAEVARIFRA